MCQNQVKYDFIEVNSNATIIHLQQIAIIFNKCCEFEKRITMEKLALKIIIIKFILISCPAAYPTIVFDENTINLGLRDLKDLNLIFLF